MSAPIHILEIRSVRGTGGGPEKTILLGAAQAAPDHTKVTVCYIRDLRDDVFGIDARAAALGVDYTEIRERHSFDPSVVPALRRLVRERSIDIIHAHDYKTNLLAWLLYRWDGVRVLATAHGWTGHSLKERRFYYPADKRLLARFPRVVAVSSDIKSVVVQHGCPPERVSVVLNGIDHHAFHRNEANVPAARERWGVRPGDVVLGAVGRLEPQKRFDLLLETFARLRSRHPRLRLVIAGDGSQRGKLEEMVRTLRLDDCCRLTGHVDDVASVHHALDLFVQSSDYEGTPNAVLEAMAFETPLVATDAGGTAELVTDGVHGLVVPAGSPERLYDALEKALSDGDASIQRARRARRRIENELSFEARMRAVESIYEELMDRPARVGAA